LNTEIRKTQKTNKTTRAKSDTDRHTDIHTDRQIESTKIITHAASWVRNNCSCYW